VFLSHTHTHKYTFAASTTTTPKTQWWDKTGAPPTPTYDTFTERNPFILNQNERRFVTTTNSPGISKWAIDKDLNNNNYDYSTEEQRTTSAPRYTSDGRRIAEEKQSEFFRPRFVFIIFCNFILISF
jgi:hypothetical protein